MHPLLARVVPFAVLLVGLFVSAPARAELRLPALFGDGAVLQRGQPLPVWGQAKPGATISVQLGEEKRTARADAFGRFFVHFAAREHGEDLRLVVTGDGRLERTGLAIGEVWLCSGQSNMAWPLRRVQNAESEIAAAQDPRLRFFRLPLRASPAPLDDCAASWTPCTPQSATEFSGVAYFFGRELRAKLGVPIGLIQSAWGGTTAEAWMSPDGLLLEQAAWSELERWQQRLASAKDDKLAKDRNRPSNLYHGMIHGLAPYALRGVIWYQGEANAPRAFEYRGVFPGLIRDWRRIWALGPFQMQPEAQQDFAFYFVQLANFTVAKNPLSWAELREAQSLALALPNTGMVTAVDIGDPKDIHPRNKQEVGRRLALIARARLYGETELPHTGPRCARARFEGERAIVQLEGVTGSLRTRDGQAPAAFAVAGTDRRFYPAQAQIVGSEIHVTSPRVPAPVAVRHAWADDPRCNVTDASALPLLPWRSDDWPGVTWPK